MRDWKFTALLLLGVALALLLAHLVSTLEQIAQCQQFNVCPGIYRPASE